MLQIVYGIELILKYKNLPSLQAILVDLEVLLCLFHPAMSNTINIKIERILWKWLAACFLILISESGFVSHFNNEWIDELAFGTICLI